MKEAGEERTELSHEAVPGYKPAFFVVLAAAALYLAVIFAATLSGWRP